MAWKSWTWHGVVDDVRCRTRRSRRRRCPPFTPPPASRQVKAWRGGRGPWCRARRSRACGRTRCRPATSVSSSSPRCFRSVSRPAIGRSTRSGLGAMVLHVAVRVPVVAGAGVDQLDEPHAALDQPPGDQALPGERLARRRAPGRRARASASVSPREVEGLGGLAHHAEGGLEAGDPAPRGSGRRAGPRRAARSGRGASQLQLARASIDRAAAAGRGSARRRGRCARP